MLVQATAAVTYLAEQIFLANAVADVSGKNLSQSLLIQFVAPAPDCLKDVCGFRWAGFKRR